MLGLPQTTDVKRPLPKAQLFKRFDWTPSQRERFDGEVSRLDFVNWISPRTVPAIAEGKEVKEIFVVEVTLKQRDFDIKNIELLGKSIPQKIIYLLRFEEELKLAVYHTKLFVSGWLRSEATLNIEGLNLDTVFYGFISQISGYRIENDSDISEIDELETQLSKIRREAEFLQKKVRNEKQFNKQIELNSQARAIKRTMKVIEARLLSKKEK